MSDPLDTQSPQELGEQWAKEGRQRIIRGGSTAEVLLCNVIFNRPGVDGAVL